MTHYSTDGKNAYEIEELHPECPIKRDRSARYMSTAKIDFEHVQDRIIEWYETNILNQRKNDTTTIEHFKSG